MPASVLKMTGRLGTQDGPSI